MSCSWDFFGEIGTDFFGEVFWQEFKNLGMLFLYSKVLEMSWGCSKVISIRNWDFQTHSTYFCHSIECYTAPKTLPSEWPTRRCQIQDSVSQYRSICIINNRIEGQFPSMSHPRHKTKNFTSYKKNSRLRKNANCILSIAHIKCVTKKIQKNFCVHINGYQWIGIVQLQYEFMTQVYY